MRFIRALLIIIPLFFAQTLVAQTAQKIFQDAVNFTVKIRSSVEIPYMEDNRGVSLGAGFIIDKKKGWILTNAHVARPSPSELKVAFKDLPFTTAKKIYVDPFLDLAIIAIDPKAIPKIATQAPLECKLSPNIGTAVGAFGHPFGLEFTGTRGIISGEADDDIGKFLRTDASINPGNSGGPLISIDTGKVVGINSASVSDTHNQNTNFAIPMPYACKVIQQLQSNKDPSPVSLQINFFEPQFDLLKLIVAKNFSDQKEIPLLPGDELISIEGHSEPIKNIGHLIDALRLKTKNVKMTIKRNNKPMVITANFKRSGLITKANTIFLNGLVIGSSVYSDLSIFPYKLSIQIYSVIPGSYANYIEIPSGGLITSIDGKEFSTIQDAYTYLDKRSKVKDAVIRIETLNLQRRDTGQIFAFKENFLPAENLRLIEGQ